MEINTIGGNYNIVSTQRPQEKLDKIQLYS